MFDSQALETAISLVLMLFLFATAASAITEIYSALLKKRAKNLEMALREMLHGGPIPNGTGGVLPADVQEIIKRATGTVGTSYLSAKSFADAATQLVAEGQNVGVLQDKMEAMAREARGHLIALKAGLETWFDETMAAASDKYNKWATYCLFATGLVLAVTLNASIINVGHDLWVDAAARQAVVSAAGSAGHAAAVCKQDGSVVQQAACNVGDISAFQLPIGWGQHQRAGWSMGGTAEAWWWLSHVLGWLLTAVLLMLGAPFWFDLLGKLVNLRSSGRPPAPAQDDDSSANALLAKTGSTLLTTPPTHVPTHDLVLQRASDRTQRAVASLSDPDIQPADFAPPLAHEMAGTNWLATALNLWPAPTPPIVSGKAGQK